MPEDLKQVVLELGAYMIKLSGLGEDIEENKNRMLENIENGKAYNKFKELVEKQEGDITYIDSLEKFEKSKFIETVVAKKDGYIEEINAQSIGKLACNLGAGRIKKEDKIDSTVGIILNKKVSKRVKTGDVLAYIHANNKDKLEEAKTGIEEIIKISDKKVEKLKTIIEIIEN